MTGRVSYTQALKKAFEDEIRVIESRIAYGPDWVSVEKLASDTGMAYLLVDWDRFVQALEQQGWVLRRTVTAQEHEALREVAVRAANGEDVRHRARTALGLSSDPPGPDDHEPPDLQCHACGGSGVVRLECQDGACPVCDGDGHHT